VETSVCDEIAADRTIGASARLRLLIQAAPFELNIDIVGCYVHHRYTPHGSAVLWARQQVKRSSEQDTLAAIVGKYQWWPFHHAGCWDRVPLYAMLERSRGSAMLRLGDGSIPEDGRTWVKPPKDSTGPFSFFSREKASQYTRLLLGGRADPHALLMFTMRDGSGTSQPSTDALRHFGDNVLKVLGDVRLNEVAVARYHDFAKQLVRFLSPGEESQKPDPLFSWFARKVHWVERILPFPNVTIRAYRVDNTPESASPSAANDGAPKQPFVCRDVCHEDASSGWNGVYMRAMDVSGDRQHRRPEDVPPRCFEQVRAAMELAQQATASHGQQHAKLPPYWTYPPTKLETSPCGLHTLAAHSGLVLYFEDVARRYCELAPLYANAFGDFDPDVRTLLAIPLTVRTDDEMRPWKSVGAVTVSTTEVAALRAADVSFLSSMLNIACLDSATQKMVRRMTDSAKGGAPA
jgi:hypothetical protein